LETCAGAGEPMHLPSDESREAQSNGHVVRCPWGFLSVDWILMGYSILIAGAILVRVLLAGPFPRAGLLSGLHLAAAAGTAVLALATRRRSAAFAVTARFAVGTVLVPVFYLSLGGLVEPMTTFRGEVLLKRIDDMLFLGSNPNVLLDRIQMPVLTEYLQIIYALYYFMPLVLFLCLLRSRGFRALERFQAAVLLSLLLSYIGYFLVPATSPSRNIHGLYPWPPYEEEIRTGVSSLPGLWSADAIRRTLYEAEAIQHDCFPSGHAAMALVVLLMARRFHSGAWRFLLVPVLSLILSTVYLRQHYVIDVVAGIGLAFLSIRFSEGIDRAFRRSWDRPPPCQEDRGRA
jgi:membrane-associated phospholipid phosphatase